jgi:outer membrane lipopolysaccharide assembly protein LptE/RlpB
MTNELVSSKYTFVCDPDECDSLIELTSSDGFGFPSGVTQLTCPCGRKTTLLSVEHATLTPTTTKEETMETTDNHYMTREFLESQLVDNKARITQLEEHIQRVTQRDYNTASVLNQLRDNMKVFTLEGLDDDSLTEFQAEEIASICGFELTNEFELTVTVQYSVTVNARDEESAINAIHETDFDTVSYDEPITYISSSIDSIEVD